MKQSFGSPGDHIPCFIFSKLADVVAPGDDLGIPGLDGV